ncbi:MAG: protein of unknown function transrane, partial [Pedosphaera sp.]|nr:protein of unknown function transrane [Pedosphaera sp.]
AAIEWLWLGTTLTHLQILCGAVTLIGIGISLAPDKRLNLTRKELFRGSLFSAAAALGGAWGAVLSRKAYAVARENSQMIDGASAAFQRIIGGLLIGGIFLLIVKWQSIKKHVTLSDDAVTLPPKEKWKRVWPWILANSLAGQTIGVSCYQWAFQTTPTGVVLPIVAMTPLVAIPFTLYLEGERPSVHSLVGGAIAVAGVVGLALLK